MNKTRFVILVSLACVSSPALSAGGFEQLPASQAIGIALAITLVFVMRDAIRVAILFGLFFRNEGRESQKQTASRSSDRLAISESWLARRDGGAGPSGVCSAAKSIRSLDQLIGAAEQRERHSKAKRLDGLDVDHKLEPDRPQHRQNSGLPALQKGKATNCDDRHIGQSALSLSFFINNWCP